MLFGGYTSHSATGEWLSPKCEANMQKQFYVQDRIGKARHVVNHHDGVKTHRDGSKFFDVTICSNKRKLAKFVAGLVSRGYVEVG